MTNGRIEKRPGHRAKSLVDLINQSPIPINHLPGLRGSDFNAAFQANQIHIEALDDTPGSHCLNRILDLPAIQLPLGELFHILACQFHSDPCVIFGRRRQAGEEFLPQKQT